MIVPFGDFYTKGDACVAPTQIYRTSPRLGCPVGARFVPSARRHRHNLGKSALSAARSADREVLALRVEKLSRCKLLRTGRRMRRPYTDLSNLTAAGMPRRRAFRSFCTASSSQSGQVCVIWGSICGPGNSCATGRKIVQLEAFTNWATHASPLHRYARRYKAGTACLGVLGRRFLLLVTLDVGAVMG